MKIVAFIVAAIILAAPAQAQEKQAFQLPEYSVRTLDNGLTVYLMERHAVPLIYVNLVFDAGAVRDGSDYGLANLTADSLLFGAGEKSKSEIEEIVDFYGAGLGSSGGREAAQVSASFAVEDAEVFFPLVRDVVLNPSFDADEFSKHVSLMTMQLERAKESPNAVIGAYFDKFIFGGHPYGNPPSGTVTTLNGITLDAVKEFYQTHYRPDTAAIVLVGAFETEAMFKRVNDLFGGWQVEGEPVPAPDLTVDESGFEKARVLLIDKDDSIQTTFMIGGKGIAMSNPDYIPVQLVNTILGGRFTSWLNTELRIKSGLSYGARSSFDTLRHGGTFNAASFTATPNTGKALELAVATLKRLHEEGIDAEMLQSGKNYMKGNFPRRYESPGQLAAFLASKHIYGLSDDFINSFAADLDSVTPERVKEVIAAHFPAENLQYVLAGRAEDIREIAKEYGEVTEVPITGDEYLSK